MRRLAADKYWIGRTADSTRVEQCIASLRPVKIAQPFIRIGGTRDGGYLVPDDLEGLGACVSPGVAAEIGFDHDMADRGIPVYMADASVEGPAIPHDKFHFFKKFLDTHEDEENFRLETLCAKISPDHNGDRILQMDIEGAEYRVILDTSDAVLKSFRIIIVEFHDLHEIFCRFSHELILATFRKLLRHHDIVHIHPNNISSAEIRFGISIPPIMEFTFYRKDRARPAAPGTPIGYPHPLDADNVEGYPSLTLPRAWWPRPSGSASSGEA